MSQNNLMFSNQLVVKPQQNKNLFCLSFKYFILEKQSGQNRIKFPHTQKYGIISITISAKENYNKKHNQECSADYSHPQAIYNISSQVYIGIIQHNTYSFSQKQVFSRAYSHFYEYHFNKRQFDKRSMTSKATILKKLAYLGAAISEGQPILGVQVGPSLIRNSGVFNLLKNNYGVDVVDYGDIKLEQRQKTLYPPVPFALRNLNVLGPLLGRIHSKAAQIVKNKSEDLLLTVGGDHSIGSATISAVMKTYSDLRVVWIDAHPDCTNSHIRNPDKIHSENYHGMPLSHVTGMTSIPPLPYWSWLTDYPLLNPKNVVLIAIRDIDPDEFITLRKHGVKCFTMDHVDKYGIGEVMTQTIKYLDPNNQHPFHLSYDVDGIDPQIVGQTGTRFRYGLNGRQSVHIVRRLAHQRKLVSMDLVEINQGLLPEQQKRPVFRGQADLTKVSKTVGMGVDLISSLCTRYFDL